MHRLCYDGETRTVQYDTPTGRVVIRGTGCGPPGTAVHTLEAVLGVLQSNWSDHLLFVTESVAVGVLGGGVVRRIVRVEFAALRGGCSEDAEGVKALIEENGFYFVLGGGDGVSPEFTWNARLMDVFDAYRSGERGGRGDGRVALKKRTAQLRTPCVRLSVLLGTDEVVCPALCGGAPRTASMPDGTPIEVLHTPAAPAPSFLCARLLCGYFESQTHHAGKCYSLSIRSLISARRIGTRMNSRGVDASGNVAFFVETGFAVQADGVDCKFTVVRGSVPLFWAQADPLRPRKLVLERTPAENSEAFKAHFQDLAGRYGRVVAVDLLGGRRHERMLSQSYAGACGMNGIEYIHFDINKQTGNFAKLQHVFHASLDHFLQAARGGGSAVEGSGNTVEGDGIIFRVNCMDCLDRTNLVQFLLFNRFHPFRFGIIKTMWKNNGNALSNFYTGSDALRADLATKGRLSVIGRMNDLIISANRMYNNRFSDGEKQRLIDLLLGRLPQ